MHNCYYNLTTDIRKYQPKKINKYQSQHTTYVIPMDISFMSVLIQVWSIYFNLISNYKPFVGKSVWPEMLENYVKTFFRICRKFWYMWHKIKENAHVKEKHFLGVNIQKCEITPKSSHNILKILNLISPHIYIQNALNFIKKCK